MKTALVTGASRGIGRATALRLARDGFRVGVHYGVNAAAAEEVVRLIEADGGSAFTLRADLGEPGEVESLAGQVRQAADRLDVLVNNAAIGTSMPMEQETVEAFDRVFAVNVRGLFFLTKLLLPLIPDGGRIVNVTSGVVHIAFPQAIAYAMTKGAVRTFTLALAKEVGPRGITVNDVAPGIIDTDLNAGWLHTPEGQAYAKSVHAVNRIGRADEIAEVIAFAASPGASFMTGRTLDATGGGNL
ncbi:SDR family oxidoreductase [Nonomuraea sp. MCN248]|uniref:SDR family oxidoreductase n=1 Tax=Nonomuraea corallina TaxID=2989783 RepID=A0ABT4SAZ0_9ACTN|nr:SDR family oxidoreductase [Nonomuraea corallina]MDA0634315.1 SDR family oxidoreductase [Nonomuraea corallina]